MTARVLIRGAADYAARVRTVRGRGPVLSNAFLLGEELDRLAAEGRLFGVETDGAFLAIVASEHYDRLHYHIAEGAGLCPPAGDKPLIAELLIRRRAGQELPAAEQAQMRLLEGAGFRPTARSQRMGAAVLSEALLSTEPTGVRPARPEELDGVLALWENCFDPSLNLLPDRRETAELIARGELLVAYGDGRCVGTVQAQCRGTQGMLRHIAVHPDCRRLGLGRRLAAGYARAARERGVTRHLLWALTDNQSAIGFHESNGYRPDGLYAHQYTLPAFGGQE